MSETGFLVFLILAQ